MLLSDFCHLSPRRVITNFELAAINSFRKVFPTTEVKWCFFHFAPGIWRKIRDLGLAGLYKEKDEIRKVVKCLVALALIPSEDVHLAFGKILETFPSDTPLMPFLEYYENTWLGASGRLGRRTKPRFDLPLWNQYEKALTGSQKTNNSVEGWHRAFQHGMGFSHPTFGKFL